MIDGRDVDALARAIPRRDRTRPRRQGAVLAVGRARPARVAHQQRRPQGLPQRRGHRGDARARPGREDGRGAGVVGRAHAAGARDDAQGRRARGRRRVRPRRGRARARASKRVRRPDRSRVARRRRAAVRARRPREHDRRARGIARSARRSTGMPETILFGEDVEDPKGGVFGFTKGLSTRHPGPRAQRAARRGDDRRRGHRARRRGPAADRRAAVHRLRRAGAQPARQPARDAALALEAASGPRRSCSTRRTAPTCPRAARGTARATKAGGRTSPGCASRCPRRRATPRRCCGPRSTSRTRR